MQHLSSLAARVAFVSRVVALLGLLLALLLPGPAARAQAPTFALATSGNNFQPTTGTSFTRATATDPATGNVYVTGSFAGQVTFGSTRLVSAGSQDVFVAKWDATAQAWTSAVGGGGTGTDIGYGIAVASAGGTTSVYATGSFTSGTNASIAGTALAGAGGFDVFVAKYTDSGTGLSTASGGAVGGGGTGEDFGHGIAVASAGGVTSVYATGSFTSGTGASIAGTALAGAGVQDVFVAKYTDSGTGLSTASGGAVGGGGTGADEGFGVAIAGPQVYVAGFVVPSASFGPTALANPAGSATNFLARLAVPAPVPVISSFSPVRGPVGTSVTITGTGLGSASSVSFNGTTQTTFASNSATEIVLLVPAGATTGTLAVTTPGGTSAASSQTFTVTNPPTLAAVLPNPGGLGQSITLTGTNLNSPTALTINGADALGNIISNTGTSLVVRVPVTAAPSGVVSLSNADGTATAPFTVMAPPGNALAFDAVDDYVAVATPAALNNLSRSAFTLEAWVYNNDVSSAVNSVIRKDGDYNLFVARGVAHVDVWPGGMGTAPYRFAEATTAVPANRWNHLAATWNGTVLRVYVNGVDASGAPGNGSVAATSPLWLGRSQTFNEPLNGRLDETRIYNVALTPAQIRADMLSTGSAVPGSLVLHYNLDQGTPATASTGANAGLTTLYDLVGAAPATLTNFALASGNTASNYVASYALVVPTATGSTARTATGFTANWTAPAVGTVTSYLLDVSTNAAFTAPIAGSPFAVTAPTTSHPLTGLNPSSAYFYRVRALNSALTPADQGGFSNAQGQATPLPVELSAFTATAEGPRAVRLTWATASEQNSASFEVERSTDGRAFGRIGTVAAAGTSTAPRTYALSDAQLPAGATVLYYRLRQVDLDGSFRYSPVRALALKGAAAGLSLYPNPATTGATLTGALPGTVVTVYDALGRFMTSIHADATGTAALVLPAGLPAGVYVVRAGSQALRLTVE